MITIVAPLLVRLLALSGWAQRRVLGHESYREVGRTPTATPDDDIFASLRSGCPTAEHR